MLEFLALTQQCAPTVAPQTMAAIVNVESKYNPYAIGVVGGRLVRQPTNRVEAIATAKALAGKGLNFSVGVAQINHRHLPLYNLSYAEAFDPCKNLQVGSKILENCYRRALKHTTESQAAIQAAISCYYSGNLTQGFYPEIKGRPSYVQKVLSSAGQIAKAIPVVPAIQPNRGLLYPNNNTNQSRTVITQNASIPLHIPAISSASIEDKSNNSIIVF